MYHSFETNLAKIYGVAEAILFNHIAFWVEKNEANKRNEFEGRYWTYNTATAFTTIFPYMSARTIQRALKHLIDEELIMIGNYDDNARNRTNYYTLTDLGKEVSANWQAALRHYGEVQHDIMAECLFNNNTDSNSVNNNTVKSNSAFSVISKDYAEKEAMFEEFWKAYPKCFRKVDKKGCKAKFIRIKNLKELFPDILASLELQKRSKQWNEKDGQFIPMPATWINQERWTIEDERLERQQIIQEIAKKNASDFLI